MRSSLRILITGFTLWAAAAPAPAQSGDAYVLLPGQVRLRVGGAYAGYDARFTPSGSQPLGSPLAQPLTAASFAPLQPVASALTGFFAATAAQGGTTPVVGPETLTFGTPDVQLFQSVTRAPVSLSLGLLPRVEVGVQLVALRDEQLIERFRLSGATVGINPAAAQNAEVLRSIGAQWAALGQAALLPTDSSALGRELQRRVRALTGRALRLPAAGADTTALQRQLVDTFGLPRLRSRVHPWRLGDAEITARVLVFTGVGPGPTPVDSAAGARFRSTLLLGARLPTGAPVDTVEVVPIDPDAGHGGYSVGLVNDLFVGTRFWGTGMVRYSVLSEADVVRRVVSPEAPLAVAVRPATVSVRPGALLELHLAPRYRLDEAIALGLDYGWLQVGRTLYTAGPDVDASVLDLDGGAEHRLGAAVRYSTLPAYAAGRSSAPLELELAYRRVLTGPPGSADTGIASVAVSLVPHLWGRPRPVTPAR